MANQTRSRRRPADRRNSSGRSSSRSRSQDGRQRSRQQQRRSSQSGSTGSRRGTLTRPDTGYTLRSRRVRRDGGRNGLSALLKPRVLLLAAIVLVVVIVMVVGISSCVRRNNEAATQANEQAQPKNEQDERVAAGVSASMTSEFTEALDRGDLLAQVAQNADKYDDVRLLELALNEPDAIAFVANYPTSDKSSRAYDGTVKRGEVPLLYDWDSHWGAVTYGDGPLAVTGSGPTTLAMAYMGLTGKTDNSPTEIAQQASKSNYTDSSSGSKPELFSKLATSLGLKTEDLDVSSETLLYTLGDYTVVAVELRDATITDDAHWALVVNMNEDGSVTLYDPTSSAVSAQPWSTGTIASSSKTFYSITISDEELAKLESGSSSSDEDEESESTSHGSSSSRSSTSSDTDEDAIEEDEY